MLTTTPFLSPDDGHGAVTHDRQAAVAAHLADERTDLARADVDADEDRFPFHRVACRPSRSPGLDEVTPDQRHVVEDPEPEVDERHQVQVQAQPIADERQHARRRSR